MNYTDGSATFWNLSSPNLPDINNENSSNPVVSYEKRSGSVDPNEATVMVIAFNHNNGSDIIPLSFYAQYESGKPLTKPSPNSQFLFYSVPYSSSGDEAFIAVSGTESKFFMYSWINQSTPYAVEYKYIDTKEPLRLGNINETGNANAIIFTQSYAIPFSMPVEFKQVQLNSTSDSLISVQNGNDNWIEAFNRLNNGLFIAKFVMPDGSAISRKLIINK